MQLSRSVYFKFLGKLTIDDNQLFQSVDGEY